MTWIHLKLEGVALQQQNQMKQLFEHGRYLEHISDNIYPSQLPENSVETAPSCVPPNLLATGGGDQMSQDETQLEVYSPIKRYLTLEQDSRAENDGRPKTYSAMRVRAPHYRHTRCEGWCSCHCHQPNYWQSTQIAGLVFGSLVIAYSGLPYCRQDCNETSCRKQSIPTIKATYRLPQWLLSRIVNFGMSYSYMNGPKMTLSVPRLVPANSDLFAYAVQGDINGIQDLFSRGLASPYDTASNNGRTALHVRICNLRL